MNNPKISVVVPVYKVEAYLRACVESILAQSFTDFEIWLVDDGSPDNCGRICEELCAKDARVSVIHQENQGVTRARAHGVEKARGEWVCFVDSDDTLPGNSLELLAARTAEDTDIIVGFTKKPKIRKKRIRLDDYRKMCVTGKKVHSGPCAKLFRKSLFNSFTFDIPRTIVKGEDMLMNIRLSFATRKDVAIVPSQVYHYLRHEESCVHSFVPTSAYEYAFHQERLRSFPEGEYPLYGKLCVKNRLKALRALCKSNAHPGPWRESPFFLQLKEDIRTTHYRLSLKERFLVRFDDDRLVKGCLLLWQICGGGRGATEL